MLLDTTVTRYDGFKSSYRQYKQDTDAVADWLATTATRLGYPKDLLKGGKSPILQESDTTAGRMKGHARKQAKDAGKACTEADSAKKGKSRPLANAQHLKEPRQYLIAVKEFTALAEWIAAHKMVPKIPAFFFNTIDRTIAGRKAHQAVWVTQRAPSADTKYPQIYDGHLHFINILESVRDVLKPHARSKTVQKGSDVSASSVTNFENRFAALNLDEKVQEPDDNAYCANKTVKSKPPNVKFAADMSEVLSEAQYAFEHILTDLDDMRQFVKSVWESQNAGQSSLIAAAIATDAAVNLARQLEEDYNHTFGEHLSLQDNMCIQLGMACLLGGVELPKDHQLDIVNCDTVWPHAERRFYPTWLHMRGFQRTSAQILGYPSGSRGASQTPQKPTKDVTEYDFPGLLDLQNVLVQLFPRMSAVAHKGARLPAEDRLTACLREIICGKELSLWMVFAAQIQVDIHKICGKDVAKGYEELVHTANSVHCAAHGIEDAFKSMTGCAQSEWTPYVSEILADISDYVAEDFGVPTPEMFKMVDPDTPFLKADFLFLKCHPWYCGLLSYNLQARVHAISLALINYSNSVVFSAHLYNAAKQEGILSRDWPAMEAAMSLHKDEEMFVGDRPRDRDKYYPRLLLILGYSARNFAPDRNYRKRPQRTTASRRILEKIAPVHDMFYDRHSLPDGRLQFSTQELAFLTSLTARFYKTQGLNEPEWSSPREVFQKSGADARSSAANGAVSFGTGRLVFPRMEIIKAANPSGLDSEAWHTKPSEGTDNVRKLHPVQLLSRIVLAIEYESPRFAFNHFSLHIQSWDMLRAVRNEVAEKVCHRNSDFPSDCERDPGEIVPYVMRKDLEVGCCRGCGSRTRYLELACEAMDKILWQKACKCSIHAGCNSEWEIDC